MCTFQTGNVAGAVKGLISIFAYSYSFGGNPKRVYFLLLNSMTVGDRLLADLADEKDLMRSLRTRFCAL